MRTEVRRAWHDVVEVELRANDGAVELVDASVVVDVEVVDGVLMLAGTPHVFHT